MKFVIVLLVSALSVACGASVNHNIKEIRERLNCLEEKLYGESEYVEDLKNNGKLSFEPKIFCQAAEVLSRYKNVKDFRDCNGEKLIRNLRVYNTHHEKNCTVPKGDEITLQNFISDLIELTKKAFAKSRG